MGYSLGEGKSLVASKGSWKVGKCEKHKFRQGCGIIMSRSSGVKKSNLMRPEHRLMQARTWLVIGWEGRLRLFMVLGWLWLWSKGNGTYCWSRRKIPRYQSRDQPEGYCSNFKKKKKEKVLILDCSSPARSLLDLNLLKCPWPQNFPRCAHPRHGIIPSNSFLLYLMLNASANVIGSAFKKIPKYGHFPAVLTLPL